MTVTPLFGRDRWHALPAGGWFWRLTLDGLASGLSVSLNNPEPARVLPGA